MPTTSMIAAPQALAGADEWLVIRRDMSVWTVAAKCTDSTYAELIETALRESVPADEWRILAPLTPAVSAPERVLRRSSSVDEALRELDQ